MRTVALPELKFSRWYRWEDRNQYPLRQFPGVYIVSITENEGLGGTPPSWDDVVYIGMTKSKGGLASRWRQFFRAIRGMRGHSGGNTIFAEKGHYDTWTEYLYVAAMGIECDVEKPGRDDYIKMGWIAYLEYEAFALFWEAVGGHPKYNTL